jgi:hypothetical protein
MEHPDVEVNQALINLADRLCQWERSTGRQSILIIKEQGGYERIYVSGKPINDPPKDLKPLFKLAE